MSINQIGNFKSSAFWVLADFMFGLGLALTSMLVVVVGGHGIGCIAIFLPWDDLTEVLKVMLSPWGIAFFSGLGLAATAFLNRWAKAVASTICVLSAILWVSGVFIFTEALWVTTLTSVPTLVCIVYHLVRAIQAWKKPSDYSQPFGPDSPLQTPHSELL